MVVFTEQMWLVLATHAHTHTPSTVTPPTPTQTQHAIKNTNMLLKINDCDDFYKTWQFLILFTENINVIFRHDEVYIQVMGSAKDSIADVAFPKSYFDEYDCSGELTVGFVGSVFLNVLKTCKALNGVLKIEASETDDNINVTITDNNNVYEYTLKSLDLTSSVMEIGRKPIQSKYKVSTETLKRWKNVLYNGQVSFCPSKKSIEIKSKDENRNGVRLIEQIESEKFKKFKENPWNKLSISSANFKLFHNMLTFGKDVTMQFCIEYPQPMNVNVKIKDKVQLSVYLAPTIEDEEEEQDELEQPSKKQKTSA